MEDIGHSMAELEKDFSTVIGNCTDAELLLQYKADLPIKNDQLSKVSKKYERILQIPPENSDVSHEVKDIGERYEHLIKLKSSYTELLNSAISSREVYKQKLFNESKLNIQLEKFSGYSDSNDFYSFKSDFNKLYEHSTPKYLLPDLLKNNHLKGPALSMVKSYTDIDKIWFQLQSAYGDVKLILSKRLAILTNTDSLNRTKDPEYLAHALSKMVNLLNDLMILAEKHKIENHLYYGDGIQHIYRLLDDTRLSRWLGSIADDDLNPKEIWIKLVKFLAKEQKLQQQKVMIQGAIWGSGSRQQKPQSDASKKNKNQDSDASKKNRSQRYGQTYNSSFSSTTSDSTCSLCDAKDGVSDHVSTSGPGNTRIIQYYTCKKFVELTPANRLSRLRDKGYCFQCLYPGADASSGKHREGRCQHDFVCPHPSHQRYPVRKHVLVCDEHKDNQDNKDLLERYKQRCIRNSNLPQFAKDISLSFHATFHVDERLQSNSQQQTIDENPSDQGIYLLQTININKERYTIFYDNGCSDFIVRSSAVKTLGSRARQESTQIIQIGGVGNTTTQSTLGTYNVKIPMHNGQTASLSGICLEDITRTFPQYPLEEVTKHIHHSFKSSGGESKNLPTPASKIGGDIHFMIGVKYLRYHPKLIYQLPSGLGIYESAFTNADGGGRGIIGGPHPVFTKIHQTFFSQPEVTSFCSNQYQLFKMGYQVNPDVSILSFPSSNQKQFEAAEMTGSEITYRCINCRTCKDCKNSDHQQDVSIKEQAEQSIIDSSIKIDLSNQSITATLPFIHNPRSKLTPNKGIALKIYYQQLRKLDQNSKDKDDIIASEAKLQQLGFVDFVHNLPEEQQLSLKNDVIQNFIPWRVVWKESSISTPCRIVFDASHPTKSGFSLNDILAKGCNNLNKLQELLIRWSTHKIGFHTDIRKMYNTIKLDEKHWCFQRYIWQSKLDSTKIPQEKVIKTIIYGVRSSGNQAERGLRETANLFKDEHPEVNNIIQNDVYVDDCITGECSTDAAHSRANELELIANRGGFHLKGVTFSGEDPPTDLTDDGSSIAVGGMKWYPKADELSISFSNLNFSKRKRGKKSLDANNVIPGDLTRRQCASKVAEIFDLTGRIAPLVASMKLDLQELSNRKLNWDDVIPDDLRPLWLTNFGMMKEIGNLRFKRSIVPNDATSLDVETLDFGDASQGLVCVSIYARFLRKNGKFSSQLVLSRTRTVPKGLSLPRAELYAALINAHTGEVVKRSFRNLLKSSTKFTDSQIALHWINNDEKPLKQWVRNRVIEIRRFTSKDHWFYIQSKDMIADLGTRRGATLKDVNQESFWINGLKWMHLPSSEFPTKSAEALKLSQTQLSEVQKEKSIQSHHSEVHHNKHLDEMRQRYEFSNYIIDPNQHCFSTTVRILAYVMRFCNKLLNHIRGTNQYDSTHLSDNEIEAAEKYFFRKGAREVIHFISETKFKRITEDKDGMLLYTGRILPENKVSIVGKFTEVMKDLATNTFCVPVLERNSPIAFSIVSDTHWNHPTVQHSGIETTLRYVLKKTHIIEGRLLVKLIKNSCQRCRYLAKRTVEMAMGPVSTYNLTIAPAFFYTQLDLSGPYQSYSPQHKRTTTKIWLIVFCCCTTSAVKIKVMDDYSTTSFIQTFIRFSCDHGFPKRLMCDEGSQLVKGCKEMKLNLIDIKSQLTKYARINFEVCPVQGHNMHGKVERKIKEINLSILKSIQNHRLSLLQWETLAANIANQINNLPLAIGDVTSDFECMDLITPNRLLLGRNNERSPSGIITCDNPTKILKENEKVFNSWFEVWLLVHVPKLMKQQKWFQSDSISVNDVVLFTKQDSVLANKYTYGIIKEIEYGEDNLPRKAIVRYKNGNENTFRETYRSVRGLVIISRVNDSDLMTELGVMAKDVDFKSKI